MATWSIKPQVIGGVDAPFFAVCPATCMLAAVAEGRVHVYSFADTVDGLQFLWSIGSCLRWHADGRLQVGGSSRAIPDLGHVTFVGPGALAIACVDGVRFVDVVTKRELTDNMVHMAIPLALAWHPTMQVLAVVVHGSSTDEIVVLGDLFRGSTEPHPEEDPRVVRRKRVSRVGPSCSVAWADGNHLLMVHGNHRDLVVYSRYLNECQAVRVGRWSQPPKLAHGFGEWCWVVTTDAGVSLVDPAAGVIGGAQPFLPAPHIHDIAGAESVAWHPGNGLFVRTHSSTIVVMGPPDVAAMWRMSVMRVAWMVAACRGSRHMGKAAFE